METKKRIRAIRKDTGNGPRHAWNTHRTAVAAQITPGTAQGLGTSLRALYGPAKASWEGKPCRGENGFDKKGGRPA